ncbi:MAG: dTDP-4-dehydrorhamnose 3,5-epimerase [Halioglobus sp.]|jgi:dTDP-4-dehydrorhamnose 3,5-epimerase
MKFLATELEGSFVVQVDPIEDDRGFFARLWCKEEFQQHGIRMNIAQANVSHNASAGTLRGLHFQWSPSQEAKLVRCERGKIFDVIVDLRPHSPTFTQHVAVELSASSQNALYVPVGFAHGFQTLEADCDVVYLMSDDYRPELADGFRFNDSAFSIDWPLSVSCISPRDRDYPDFDPSAYCRRYSSNLEHGGKPG